MLTLSLGSSEGLLRYVGRQLDHLFPDGNGKAELPALQAGLETALRRLERCIGEVRMWAPGRFDHLHSSQYTIFLYYLANTIWTSGGGRALCNKLFGLNKALNGIDLFYEIDLPEVFFIGHSVGIVLAKATYGNRLVLYQACTVGKNHGEAPVLGDGVVMYPGTAIIGRCEIRAGTVISQGTSIVNRSTPGNCMVFPGKAGGLVVKPPTRDVLADLFR